MSNIGEPQQKNTKSSAVHYAMTYGVALGILWAFRYFIYEARDVWVHLIYFYYLLNAATFLLIYIFYFKYRDSEPGKQKRKLKCIGFVILLCFFASFFEAGAMFLHLQIIDPTHFTTHIEPIIRNAVETSAKTMSTVDDPEIAKRVKDAQVAVYNFFTNKIVYIFLNVFLQNILLGAILGPIFALLIGNKKLN